MTVSTTERISLGTALANQNLADLLIDEMENTDLSTMIFVGATGVNQITMPTNLADALSFVDSAGDLMVFDTTTGSQTVSITPRLSLGGVTPVVGTTLLIPQEDDAVTPTFAFGDGDTGFYESVDDTVRMAFAGVAVWQFTATQFGGRGNSRPSFLDETPSGTNPNIIPDFADLDTGIGTAGANQISLIAGGVEAMRLSATETASNNYLGLKITDTDGGVEGSIWYDASEDKLKFKTAAGVETITSS
jgi:hypothetical protein